MELVARAGGGEGGEGQFSEIGHRQIILSLSLSLSLSLCWVSRENRKGGFVLPQRRRGRREVLWFSCLLSAICCAKRAGFPRRREGAKRALFYRRVCFAKATQTEDAEAAERFFGFPISYLLSAARSALVSREGAKRACWMRIKMRIR